MFGQSSKLACLCNLLLLFSSLSAFGRRLAWREGSSQESLTTINGKIIPSTNSPIQLMQPTIRKADGLYDWLKISTMIDTVAPAEKEEQNMDKVFFFP